MVVSWGRGEDGQLGHGDANERPFPQTVHALTDADIDNIFCGAEYSAAVSSSRREVFSWGWYGMHFAVQWEALRFGIGGDPSS